MTPRVAHRHGRRVTGVALAIVGIVVVLGQGSVRQIEAELVGGFASHVLGLTTIVNPIHPEVFFPLPSAHGAPTAWIGLVVTVECTSAWLIGPLLALAGLVTAGRRLRLRAVFAAVAASATVFLVTNLARLTVIVVATHRWGIANGFTPTHDLYGSILSVMGVCVGVALFVAIATRLSRSPALVPEGA